MAELIKIPFGMRTRVGPRSHVLVGGPVPPHRKGQFLGGKGCPSIKYKDLPP